MPRLYPCLRTSCKLHGKQRSQLLRQAGLSQLYDIFADLVFSFPLHRVRMQFFR